MPTGYTSSVVDGQVTEFRDFALQCARAFGALVTMREDPWDTPIPDKIEPSSYYADQIKEDELQLKVVLSMTDAECDNAAVIEHNQQKARIENSLAKAQLENERICAMLEKVSAWGPPSPDHVEMKDFMLKQLNMSINDLQYYEKMSRKLDGREWREKTVNELKRKIEYNTKHHIDELNRAAKRTRWIQQLKESLS